MNKVSFFIRQSNDNLNRLGNLCIHDTFKMARNDFLSEANCISPLLCIGNVTQCNLKNSHHLTGIIAVGYDGMPLYMINRLCLIGKLLLDGLKVFFLDATDGNLSL